MEQARRRPQGSQGVKEERPVYRVIGLGDIEEEGGTRGVRGIECVWEQGGEQDVIRNLPPRKEGSLLKANGRGGGRG